MTTRGPNISSWIRGLLFPALCLRLTAATVTLPAVADTSIFEANPDFNLGGTTLVSGTNQQYSRSRAMFRFDLSSLPAGALVTNAEVLLYVSRRPDPDQHGGPVDSNFSLYRMFVSWGQGTGGNATGSTAAAGDATWNERHYGSTSWASPGALIGVDYAGTASATTAVSGVGGYVWRTSAALVDDVRAWLNTPESNFGFILVSNEEASVGSGRRFGSTEQPGGLIPPPQLVVTYNDVPEFAASGMILLGFAGLALLRFRRV